MRLVTWLITVYQVINMPRSRTNSTVVSRPPRFREVVVLPVPTKNGKQNKKRDDKSLLDPTSFSSTGSSIGGQSYAKLSKISNVLGGFSGTDLFVERTEAMYTVSAQSVAGTFKIETLTQFPGFSGFNWLKNLSQSYAEYEVHRVEYTYIPTVPTTTAGVVAMSFYSDIRDAPPSNLGQVLSSEQSLMAPVYAGGDGGTYLQRFGSPAGNVVSFELPAHVLRFSNGVPKRFKNTTDAGMSSIIGAGNGQAVANQYAWGELNVASEGVPTAGQTLGTVFIRYRIRLIGPIPAGNQS